MTTEDFALQVIGQLKNIQQYRDSDVEAVINASVKEIAEYNLNVKDYIFELEGLLEEVSPLNFNSIQWSNIKYTLIYLRELEEYPSIAIK